MLRAALLGLGILAALLIVAGVTLAVGLNSRLAVPLIEHQASRFLDRQVHIGEPPTITLGRSLTVSLGELRIENASWAGSDPLLDLKSLKFSLSTRSLLQRRLDVLNLELDGVNLKLAVDDKGKSNLPEVLQSSEAGNTDDKSGRASGTTPFPLLRRASITNLELTRSSATDSTALELRIDKLQQTSMGVEQHLRIRGDGTLLDRPWSVEIDGSSLRSAVEGLDLSASFTATLADLKLTGDFTLPVLEELKDLSLHAQLEGSLPPRIASLSPLLDADAPMVATLDVSDVDPGIAVELKLDFSSLDVLVSGQVARPGSGDGLNLTTSLNAASLPRLARALKLGETSDVPLAISAQIQRDGRRLSITDIDVNAGEHQIIGSILLPFLPGTDDAELDLGGSGPDFAFFQRLLNRPPSLEAPYTLNLRVIADTAGSERIDSELTIGTATLALKGLLGEFPSYKNSDLKLRLDGPSLSALGANAGVELPDSPYSLDGQVTVSDASIIRISSLNARTLGLEATLTGQLHSYPELDEIDLRLTLHAASLAASTVAMNLPELGDVPVDAALNIQGSLDHLVLSDVALQAGGLKLDTQKGSLQFPDGVPQSDLRLAVAIEQLNELLGSLANPKFPKERISFALQPRIFDKHFQVSLEDLRGPGVSGRATFELSRELLIDARTSFETDLQIDALSHYLPDQSTYRAPDTPLLVHAETRGTGERRINAVLSNSQNELLTASINLPSRKNPGLTVNIRGQGPALRALGDAELLPPGPLPYDIDIDVQLLDERQELTLRTLEIAGTRIEGTLALEPEARHLRGELKIPHGELDLWLRRGPQSDASQSPGSPEKTAKERLIPNSRIPLELLDHYSTNLHLITGQLGLADPVFSNESLVDHASIHLISDEQSATLTVEDIAGSRGSLTGKLELLRVDEHADIHATLAWLKFPVGFTSRSTSFSLLPLHDLSIEMRAHGQTVRELAGTLEGPVFLTGGSGTLTKMSLSVATESFTAQLLRTLLPTIATKNPDVKVECTVLAARARSGVLTLDPGFVFRSKRIDLAARGAIDLRDETLRVRFDNQARKGFGISAASLVNPYVQITGSLARPTLGLDLASSAFSGGAAVATGGLSVLAKPLYGRFLKRGNPCTEARERWADLVSSEQG